MILIKLALSLKANCCGNLSPRRVAATYRLVCPDLNACFFYFLEPVKIRPAQPKGKKILSTLSIMTQNNVVAESHVSYE